MKKVIVIGAGPAGYVAAIKAAQEGFDTTCIEKQYLGGTCLNVGCIPSKVLLNYSHICHRYKHTPDISLMHKEKESTVTANTKGIAYLFKKNNVKHIVGNATFASDGLYLDNNKLTADYIIIAVGSEPSTILNAKFDEKRILSSTGALGLDYLPDRIITVGAGYIGLELSAVFARLGSDVTVLEYQKSIFSEMEPEVAPVVTKALKDEGVKIKTGISVTAIEAISDGVKITADKEYMCNVAMISVGRRPNTDSIGLEKIGITTDAKGFINVDSSFSTSVKGIYAIGDCINGPMLAHRAYQDAKILVDYLKNATDIEPTYVPGIVYIHPEVANVGETQKSAQDKYGPNKVDVRISQFASNPRARIMGESSGFVKVVYAKDNGRILGATIVGPEAGNMIHEFCVAMAFGGSIKDMSLICHGHPTLNEIIVDTCDLMPVH